MQATKRKIDIDYTKYDFRDEVKYVYQSKRGLSREVVEEISYWKNEPEWMRQFRLHSLPLF